ncbi:8220_t:CDS:10 [Entrophospora sp. SA101]|nr:8220_t:CDS:10 [Entrophospora sp. SA101]
MNSPLNLYLCQEDPPEFRKELFSCENSLFGLETCIENLVKLARSSVEIASEYTRKQFQFAEELKNFAIQQPESIIKSFLIKYSTSLQEIEKSRGILNSSVNSMFIESLESFKKNEISPLKAMKKKFEKASNEADIALHNYMNKTPSSTKIYEASVEVSKTRKELHLRYIDYVLKLNQLEAKKQFEFMEYILALMFSGKSFYHQCYETMKDLEPGMKNVTKLLHETRSKYDSDLKTSDKIKQSILEMAKDTYNPLNSFKKSIRKVNIDKRVMQSWSRKYFTISGELLYYRNRNIKIPNNEISGVIKLRVCHVKPIDNIDKRFCFVIISPTRTYILQAENQEDMEDWINCLNAAATMALYSDNVSTSSQKVDSNISQFRESGLTKEELQLKYNFINKIKEIAGNSKCADCRTSVHRSLGVHISKVRSLMLDKWEQESIDIMLKLGNSKINEIFEAKLDEDYKNKIITDPSWKRDKFITDKYVKKEFVARKDDESSNSLEIINMEFWNAMNQTNLYEALRYLALGADVDWKNQEKNSTTSLHQAIQRNDELALEFLFLWQVDINSVDKDDGKLPVDIAIDLQNIEAIIALNPNKFKISENSSFEEDETEEESVITVSEPYNEQKFCFSENPEKAFSFGTETSKAISFSFGQAKKRLPSDSNLRIYDNQYHLQYRWICDVFQQISKLPSPSPSSYKVKSFGIITSPFDASDIIHLNNQSTSIIVIASSSGRLDIFLEVDKIEAILDSDINFHATTERVSLESRTAPIKLSIDDIIRLKSMGFPETDKLEFPPNYNRVNSELIRRISLTTVNEIIPIKSSAHTLINTFFYISKANRILQKRIIQSNPIFGEFENEYFDMLNRVQDDLNGENVEAALDKETGLIEETTSKIQEAQERPKSLNL